MLREVSSPIQGRGTASHPLVGHGPDSATKPGSNVLGQQEQQMIDFEVVWQRIVSAGGYGARRPR